MTTDPTPPPAYDIHPLDERCFYCASDGELSAALAGRPHPTIHMSTPPSACPHEAAAAFTEEAGDA